MPEDLVGATLGQYRVLDLIGQGGMAAVYRGYQPSLDRFVAIKVLPSYFAHDPQFSERFRREALSIARLEHPNILPVYDFGEQDNVAYIVMSLVAGGTLKSRMGSPLPLEWSVRICSQLAQALHHAHSHGIVHRDVKPANVLLGPDDRPLLADFGIARLLAPATRLTRTGFGVGTPEYMSPEQGHGLPVDGRTDLYALAMMLFEMLTGTVPYVAGSALAVILKQINDPVPKLRDSDPSLPEPVDKVVQRALAKQPGDRFESTVEFAEALQMAIAPPPAELAPPRAEVSPPKRSGHRPEWGRAAAAAGVAALVLALVVFAFLGDGPSEIEPAPAPADDIAPTPAAPLGGGPRARETLLPERLALEITSTTCSNISGRVRSEDGPVRGGYFISGGITSERGGARPIFEGVRVPGPDFQLAYPLPLPPGTYEVKVSAFRPEQARSNVAIAVVTC